MSRRKRVLVAFLILGAAGAGLFVYSTRRRQPRAPLEPSYRGRLLSSWLRDYDPGYWGVVVLSDEATAAVRAMGTDAIPMLLYWLRQNDSLVDRTAQVWLVERLGLRLNVASKYNEWGNAILGFRALGLAAKSAFPAITEIALHSPDERQRGAAAAALSEADADTMRSIAAALKDPDREIRQHAIDAIRGLHIALDEVCYPALEAAAATDTDPRIREEAKITIGWLEKPLEEYARYLGNQEANARRVAAERLGDQGKRAREYLPELRAAAQDSDASVRAAAGEAVRKVEASIARAEK